MNELHSLHPENLHELLANKSFHTLKELLADTHPSDISDLIVELPKSQALGVMRLLSKEEAAEVFSYLDGDDQRDLFDAIGIDETRALLEEMDVDDAVDFLSELPANMVSELLKHSTADRRILINQFLNFAEDSAGGLMSVEFIRFPETMMVRDAIAQLRSQAAEDNILDTIYLTTLGRTLTGVLSLRELLIGDDDALLRDLAHTRIISVRTDTKQEEVLHLFQDYDFLTLPVLDSESRLVGIITMDDVLDVSTEEATKDIQMMAASSPDETPYLEAGVLQLTKNRFIWLLLLMISGMLNGEILARYEHAFVVMPILVSFIPMLTDSGGNAGSQTSTLVIRAITLKEIGFRDMPLVLWKELRISLLAGVGLSVINFVRLFFLDNQPLPVALTVSFALLGIVIMSKVIASMLPFLAKAVKLDPAVMAAPLITTLVDAGGLIFYFQLAHMILKI